MLLVEKRVAFMQIGKIKEIDKGDFLTSLLVHFEMKLGTLKRLC